MRTGFARKETRTRQPITLTSLALLGIFLLGFNWSLLSNLEGVNKKLGLVNEVLFAAQDSFCPLEEFTVKVDRYPFASARLASLSCSKSKEFKKNGYSSEFKRLKKACREEIRCARRKRIDEAVQAGKGNNSWLGKLERLLDTYGNSCKSGGVLPEHQVAGLSRQQCQ